MSNRDYATVWIVGVAAGMGGGVFVAVASFYFQFGLNFCHPDEPACAREWVGALSGWAAAFAAGLTIFYIIQQTREAARQTEFIVGEALPTTALFDPRETRVESAFSTRLDVINWNRHPLLIKSITVDDMSSLTIHVQVEDHDTGRRNILERELRAERMFVPGWIDRTKSPTVAEFSVTVHTEDAAAKQFSHDGMVRGVLRLKIECRIASATPIDITLRAHKSDALMLV